MQSGADLSGVSLMRFIARLIVPLSVGLLTTLAPVDLALAQEVPTADTMLGNLSGLQAPSDLEVPALRLQAADRVKSRSDALKRPLLVPQLNRLPHVNVDIQFNPDSPVIRPNPIAPSRGSPTSSPLRR